MRHRGVATLCTGLVATAALAQVASKSGGPLPFEEAVYDVKSYDVGLKVDPADKSIQGTTKMVAKAVIPSNAILLDLDSRFSVQMVTDGRYPLKFDRQDNTVRIFFPQSKQPGETITTVVTYSGKPKVAKNAPWDGAFVWAKTKGGQPWVSVALEDDGADMLFPCKDHPSDRPDEVWMRITVPDPLVAVGPGVESAPPAKHADKTTTYSWHMPLPIANYSVVFNAAPYDLVEDSVKSVGGQTVKIPFYVLPEDKDKAPKLIAELKKYFAFMEKYCGPYPFRTVKLGVVETPHLGMEHSTAIAYGNKFRFRDDGFDWLMLHEFGHEWWANLVTASDWRDMWVHEGFQSYMDSLYQEETHGRAAYLASMKGRKQAVQNKIAVAPRQSMSSSDIYTGDIYDKGALVLHSLRFLVGDKRFFDCLRRMAYPTAEMETWTDGRAQRLVTTDDFLSIAERESGMRLDWFFEVYLRQPALPKLQSEVKDGVLHLAWQTPDGLRFPMPVEVEVDGKRTRVPMKDGKGSLKVDGSSFKIDPDGWVLMAR
ncbi:MAG: M1 family metallopeptidase [Fimbriimonadaceae bacterium]|nr:M1 family metallopeptidase [Fimbriimonadaceae bacterium]